MSDDRTTKRELRAANERKQAVLDALHRRPSHSLETQQRLSSLSVETLEVQCCPDRTYQPPALARRILTRPLLQTLSERLAELQSFNDTMAGVSVEHAEIALHAAQECRALIERWLAWADAYVAHRLTRRNPKDNGNPLRTYLRIYGELVPWFEELAFGSRDNNGIQTVHRHILGTVVEFIPWRLFHATWGEWLRIEGSGAARIFPTLRLSEDEAESSQRHLELYRFHTGAGLDIILHAVEAAPISEALSEILCARPNRLK